MHEEWRPVPGFQGLYEISDRGRVRSLPRIVSRRNRWGGITERTEPGVVLSVERGVSQYARVTLCRPGERKPMVLHHLVLEVFHGPRPEGQVGRHLDGNPDNNRADNLAWGTYRENEADKLRHGTRRFGEQVNFATITEDTVLAMRAAYLAGASCKEVAQQFGVRFSCACYAIKGRTWPHLPLPDYSKRVRKGGPIPGSWNIGSKSGQAKLHEHDVAEIKRLRTMGVSQRAVARRFGVSRSAIAHIDQGSTWTHVEAA